MAKYIYMFILHCGIRNIIQFDTGTEFNGIIIVLIVQDDRKLINTYQKCGHCSHGSIWYQNDERSTLNSSDSRIDGTS